MRDYRTNAELLGMWEAAVAPWLAELKLAAPSGD